MNDFYVGFGRQDISNDKVLPLNSTRSSGTILTPIKTTCVCLSDGKTRVLVFSNDLRNTTARIAADMKQRIEEKTGVPSENMFIVATHNHSAPDVNFYGLEDIHDWLFRIVYPAMVLAAENAIADLSPCEKLLSGASLVDQVTFVRRYFRSDGTFAGIVVPKTSNAPIERHETEADRELRALRFVRTGKKDVVMMNFQVHAATGANKDPQYVCADFVHHLREKAEAEDDVLVQYVQGGCGNLNTYAKVPGEPGCNEDYPLAGRLLADGLKAALQDAREIPLGKIQVKNGTYLGVVNHAKSHLAGKVEELNRYFEEHGIKDAKEKNRLYVEAGFSSRYEASAILKRSRYGKTQNVPLSSVAFGDTALTFTPFETFDENSRAVRQASPFAVTFTCGYTNAYMGYLPSSFGFSNGGYEPLQCDYLPGTGEAVSLELLRQLAELKKEQN